MCFLGQQKFLEKLSLRKKISEISPEQAALKKKNDARAFALLRILSSHQTAPTADLSAYPVLAKYLTEKKSK